MSWGGGGHIEGEMGGGVCHIGKVGGGEEGMMGGETEGGMQ